MTDQLPAGITLEDILRFKRLTARCWIVAGLLIELPLEALDRFTADAETMGPAIYPDIWRAHAKAIMEDREMIRALATAQRDVLTTSPNLLALIPVIEDAANTFRPRLLAAFRSFFSRPELAEIPPTVILSVLVSFIAASVPNLDTRDGQT